MVKKIVGNGRLFTFGDDPKVIENGAVAFEDDTILEVGTTQEIREKYADFEFLDVDEKCIWPGLICGHTHFYGMYARGMALKDDPPSNFLEILQRLWWRMDKALDEESIEKSALVCLVECIRNGVTTVIDHHASPNFIKGSLDTIADATQRAGIRACLCYEISDRNGPEEALEGIKENVRFLKRCIKEKNPMLSGLCGLHASFTVTDETLDKCVEETKDLDTGYHIHVGEGITDVDETVERDGLPCVHRLKKHGLLGPKSIFAHCVHTSPEEHQLLADSGTNVMHCPQSNQNNGVGVTPVPSMLEKGVCVGIGTDGCTHNMFVETQSAYYVHKLAVFDPRPMGAEPLMMLMQNNGKIASKLFQKPLGVLEKGAHADIIILDYYPPTEMNASNVAWHMQFGMHTSMVHTSICAGKTILENHKTITLNPKEINERSRAIAPGVWERF